MDSVVGKWGLYPWFNEYGESMIHLNDYEAFKQLNPYGKVFYCESQAGGYITLKYSDKSYKVKPELFRSVAAPMFKFEDEVIIINKDELGVVTDIKWHYANAQEFYHLTVNGKRKSKRYFSQDLKKI